MREWLAVYRSVGVEALAIMGKKHATYSFETKLSAVRAVVDEGMPKLEAIDSALLARSRSITGALSLIDLQVED